MLGGRFVSRPNLTGHSTWFWVVADLDGGGGAREDGPLEERAKTMSDRQRQLLRTIEDAFRGVHLAEGVSLHETRVIDDYGGLAAQQAARASDEQIDWRKLIDNPELARINGLSFYDALGLRFHLPAYLTLAVTDFEREDADLMFESLMYHLTVFTEYNLARLAILDAEQRLCVRDVLVYLRETYELESAELDRAIEGYWSSVAGPVNAG